MVLKDIDASQRSAAKVVGFALVLAMGIAVLGEFYVSSGLIVPGDAADTARNLLAHGTRFRLSVACHLLHVVTLVALLTALHVIFEPVDRGLSLIAAGCRSVYAFTWVLAALDRLAALRLLDGPAYTRVFEAERLQALARLHLTGNFDAYYVGLPFFALASLICAYLWLRSGYLPRLWAAFGVTASAWGVGCAFAFLVFPDFNRLVGDWWFDTPLGLFEVGTGLWLLAKGLRPPRAVETGNAALRRHSPAGLA